MKHLSFLFLALVTFIITMACTSHDEEQPNDTIAIRNTLVSMEEAHSRLVEILDNPAIKQNFHITHKSDLLSNEFYVTNGRALDSEGKILTRADMNEACVYIFDIDTIERYAIMDSSTMSLSIAA